MNSLSKIFYTIAFSSSFIFSVYGMDENLSEFEDLKNIDQWLAKASKWNENEILKEAASFLLSEDDIDPNKVKMFSHIIPSMLKKVLPAYKNLPGTSKKLLVQLYDGLVIVINEKIAQIKDKEQKETLELLLNTIEPLGALINDNSNAGIIKQFSLLDLSGKMIVGISLPFAFYGAYKAWQTYISNYCKQEVLV